MVQRGSQSCRNDETPELTESERRMELAKGVTERYKVLSELEFVCVGGSTAIGLADIESDIDMHMGFAPAIPSDEKRKVIINRLVTEYGNEEQPQFRTMGPADGFRVSGIDISVFMGTVEQFVQIPENRDAVMGSDRETGTSEYFDAVCLYDRSGHWGRVYDALSEYPPDLKRKIISDNMEKLRTILSDDSQKAVRARNAFLLHDLQKEATESTIRVLCAIHGRYYRRPRELPGISHSMKSVCVGWESDLANIVKTRSPKQFRVGLRRIISTLEGHTECEEGVGKA